MTNGARAIPLLHPDGLRRQPRRLGEPDSRLREEIPCTIAVDHRGSGESEAPVKRLQRSRSSPTTRSASSTASGVERAHVLGYSMGGRVGQDMAARYPDRVSALILAASAAKPNPLNIYSLRASAWLYETYGPEAAAAFGPLISFTHGYFEEHLDSLTGPARRPSSSNPCRSTPTGGMWRPSRTTIRPPPCTGSSRRRWC